MRRLAVAVLLLMVAGSAWAGSQIYRNNVQTAQHVLVPGTQVRIIPPAGSVSASGFRGYDLASRQASLRIEERMGASISALERSFTKEALEAQGIDLLDSSKVTLNGGPGFFLTCRRPAAEDGSTQETGLLIFAFEGQGRSAIIYGTYPISDRGAVPLLRDSMLSAMAASEQQTQSTGGGYQVSLDGTALQFVGEASMVRYFTVGGKPVPEAGLEDALFSTSQRNQLIAAADQERMAELSMQQYMSNFEHKITSKRPVSYAGFSGWEILAEFDGASRRRKTASGATRNVVQRGIGYQVILFDPKGVFYTFNGIAVRDSDNYLGQFRKVTSTFQLVR